MLVALLAAGCGRQVTVQQVDVIPEPVFMVQKEGSFTLHSNPKVSMLNVGQNSATVKYVMKSLRQLHLRPKLVAPSENYDIELRYWIARSKQTSAIAIQTAAEQAVEDYVSWQKEKLGRDLEPTELIFKLRSAGVKRVEVIEPKFLRAGEFHEGLAKVNIKGHWGYVNKEGKVAIRASYYEAGDFNFGLAPVRTKRNYRGWGFISHQNRFAIPRWFNNLGNFGDGIAPAAADARWGYVNVRGEWEISPQFEDARSFSEGLAAVKVENSWGYIRY